MSHVMCHVSRVTCHMSRVTCHMSHVMCHMSRVTFFFFFGQSGEAYLWRVCYQRGLPRLVFRKVPLKFMTISRIHALMKTCFDQWRGAPLGSPCTAVPPPSTGAPAPPWLSAPQTLHLFQPQTGGVQ